MRNEDLLPPSVRDLIRSLRDEKSEGYARDNLRVRLEAIETECRKALREYRVSSQGQSRQRRLGGR